ncbi:MAG: glycoside hydrolase family 97 catalytic domain-containing protein [Spongiibacteraceae bacterium]|nr:glycoside hydrolase family 97 catalytic domain-containing protein [Spongiibacteraceae bacterium]
MKQILTILLLAAPLISLANSHSIKSPNSTIEAIVKLSNTNTLTYSIKHKGKQVLQESTLGITLQDANLVQGLTLLAVSKQKRVDDHYQMQTGKRKDIHYTANEKTFSLSNAKKQKMDIIFRVSDDGVAFRYHFPGKSQSKKIIKQEHTSFTFAEKTKAWLQAMSIAQTGWKNTNPSYEEHYQMEIPVGTPSPTQAGWVFPALFKTQHTWLLITEAGMDGRYSASRLQQYSNNREYRLGFPMAAEVFSGGALLPQSTLPFHSPWRIILVGSLATVVESTLGTDLAAPAISLDLSFIKPGHASWSWALLKDDSITYDIQKEFIDYASDMHWEYTLIDVNWDTTIGYEKIKELANYAKTKNVGLLLWYNSSGDWNQTDYHPKSQLLNHTDRVKEFRRLREMGIKGIKVDFFAGDGQSMMQYYNDILQDAADHQLLVNFHGCTLPRGLQRTYPNLMTMESIKGFEFITFFQESADLEASHATMLPFSRNAFDPMDFTPMVLDNIPNIKRKTSNGFQLALPIIFLSGIQHLAETPAGMKNVPEYVKTFLRNIPQQWDNSTLIDGYPGKLAVIARQSGSSWYIAGINGETHSKKLSLKLPFNHQKKGYLLNDHASSGAVIKKTITAKNTLDIEIQSQGGFVIVFN